MRITLTQRPRNQRVEHAALRAGYTPLQAHLLAGRLPDQAADNIARHTSPTLADLDAPDSLPDIEVAADAVATAIIQGRRLLVISDHDCDGQSGMAILRAALMDWFHHPPDRLHSYVGHRMREGYGVSDGVTQRILDDGVDGALAITCDIGSADEARIAQLRTRGIETCVTDHHEIGDEGPPASALACVNPIREDSRFPDPLICGGYTAWLLMAAVRRELMRRGRLPENTPHLTRLLDYAACSTVADVVSLGRSRNNRAVINHGLALMNAEARPCWTVLRERFGLQDGFTAETVAFKLGPLINSSGRLHDGTGGVRLLRAPTVEAAERAFDALLQMNTERREIQARLVEAAQQRAEAMAADGARGIALWLPDGHAGVHGVVASRLTELTGRPTVCLSPVEGDAAMASGSARTVTGIHVRQALAWVDAHYPGTLERYGGHAGAGGLRVKRANIARVVEAWDEAVAVQAGARSLEPERLTDGELPRTPDEVMLAEIAALEPYGREFEPPLFEAALRVCGLRAVGSDGRHLKLDVQDRFGRLLPAIWFNAVDKGQAPVAEGDRFRAAVVPSANTFRGRTSVQLRIDAGWRTPA
jgi:single-stranded-DNA-specific exonuclease